MWSGNGEEAAGGAGFVKDDAPGKAENRNQDNRTRRVMPVNSQILRTLAVPAVSGLVIHRQRMNYVSLVGQVVKIDLNSTKVELSILDSYGPPVEVLFWQGEERCRGIEADMWVEVVGSPREVDKVVGIYAFSIHKITDATQIINHNLEIILYSRALEKMKNNFLSGSNLDSGLPNYDDPALSTLQGQQVDVFKSSYNSAPAASHDSSSSGGNSMQALGKRVTAYLEKEAPEAGAHINDIRKALNLDPAKLKQVMEFLSSEGHVYTTTDDDHFKSTEG